MARGLFDKWKQPIFVDFDTKMTPEILNSLITKLHTAGMDVRACTSDCGGGNVGLWSIFGFTSEITYFLHPVTKKHIYFFADAPHLLKLFRNWFIDGGFELASGSQIDKYPIAEIINANTSEVSSVFKLTTNHLYVDLLKRQNVSLAAQLMSHTTATALRHYGTMTKTRTDLANFIELVDSWFSLYNSYFKYAKESKKNAYGTNLIEQNKVLSEIEELIKTMKCLKHKFKLNLKNEDAEPSLNPIPKFKLNLKNEDAGPSLKPKVLQVFEKGILMSTASLQNLYLDLKNEFNIDFIITHRLNQDCLENLFGHLRTMGGLNDTPSPLDSLSRMRLIILGKNNGDLQEKKNILSLADITKSENEDEKHVEDSFVLADLFSDIFHEQPLELDEEKKDPDENFQISEENHEELHKIESDGHEYLAGWLARKYKLKYPELGKYTYQLGNSSESEKGWTETLSYGGKFSYSLLSFLLIFFYLCRFNYAI